MLPFLAGMPAAGKPQAARGPSADPERMIEYLTSRNEFLVDSICKLAAENERLRDYHHGFLVQPNGSVEAVLL